ncbi:MAG: PASTA domain-containing protein [Pseudomonadota bacterium]
MTRKLQISARLINGAGQPEQNAPVEAQAFHLTRGWVGLAEGRTNAQGDLKLQGAVEGEGNFAPALRLVRPGRQPVEVLAQNATYGATRTTLQATFGEVTLLPGPGTAAPQINLRTRPDRVIGTSASVADLLRGGAVLTDTRDGAVLGDRRESVRVPERDAGEAISDKPVFDARVMGVYSEMLTAETLKRQQLEAQLEVKVSRESELNESLKRVEAERETLRDDLDVIRRSQESSPTINNLAGAMSGALNQARDQGGLELVGAEIRLRGIVSEAGARFHPLDAVEARNIRPENVSELVLRLDPPKRRESTSARVPDLIGQTVGPARRLALGAGLALEVIEALSSKHPAGAIFQQIPEAGSVLDEAEGHVSVVVAAVRGNQENDS